MKTILCYGDSNTWGADPATGDRFDRFTRWPGALRELLNASSPAGDPAYWVLEEGLCGRTTCRDDPVEGDRNGLAQAAAIFESHRPLELIVVLLGTNDLKVRYSPTAFDIARGAQRVARLAMTSGAGPDGLNPEVLLVAPPPVATLSYFKGMFGSCQKISKELADQYRICADELGCSFMDAGDLVRSSELDGIHWEREEHLKFAEALAKFIPELIG